MMHHARLPKQAEVHVTKDAHTPLDSKSTERGEGLKSTERGERLKKHETRLINIHGPYIGFTL